MNIRTLSSIFLFLAMFCNFAYGQATELFISEYAEGSSNNKYIEIYNGTGATVDLSSYELWRISNGGDWTEGQSNAVSLSGMLADGDVFVICNSSADSAGIQIHSDVVGTTATYFNGDDAMGLAKNGVLIDAVGSAGPDVGTGWTVAGVANATAEHTLVRASNVCSPDTAFVTSTALTDWIVYPQNTWTNIGVHTANCNVSPTAPIVSNVLISPSNPAENDPVSVSATITDNGTISSVYLFWGTSSGNLNDSIMMTLQSGSDYMSSTTIPGQVAGIQVFYMVKAIDNSGEIGMSAEYNYLIPLPIVPVSIYDIQYTTDPSGDSPYANQTVTTSGIVTAASSGGFYLQDGTGVWTGVWVYTSTYSVTQGDSVTLTGDVQEYYNLTEIHNLSNLSVLNSNNTLPNASIITIGELTEAYECCLVRVEGAECVTAPNSYNEWEISDGTNTGKVNDQFYVYTPTVGSLYNVTGCLNYNYNEYKIEPRDASDVESAVASTEANILSFSMTEEIAPATIDTVAATVYLEVLNGTVLNALVPTITVSQGATISPASGIAQDFSQPIIYTVTAQDTTMTKTWTVTVVEAAVSSDADIIAFSVTSQSGSAIIDATTQTVTAEVVYGTDLTNLTPAISVSAGATITPASGISQDFTSAVDYTVTAQDTTVTKTWTITITEAAEQMGSLFFSEYIEGTSNNKGLELYNGSDSIINLSDFQIAQSSNGGGWAYFHEFPAGASLNPGEVWTIVTTQTSSTFYDISNADEALAYPSVTHHNGNDARGLFYMNGSDTTWVDIIGTPNTDPGDGWDVAGILAATKDHTLVRKTGITHGNTDWISSAGTDTSNSEWIVMDVNEFSFFGWHTTGGNMPPIVTGVEIITESMMFTNPSENESAYVAAEISDLDGTISSAELFWGTDGTTYPNNISMSVNSGIPGLPTGTYSTHPTLIPGQLSGTTIYLKIIAVDDASDSTEYFSNYTVIPSDLTIYDIQYTTDPTGESPYFGMNVTVSGIITAYDSTTNGFFVQDGTGAWNGIFVYNPSGILAEMGDSVTITGDVDEYYTLTELKNINMTIHSSGNDLPSPSLVPSGSVSREEWEGVLVNVQNATCINSDAGNGQWIADDGSGEVLIDDFYYSYTADNGGHYDITGCVYFSFDEFKIEPRFSDDIQITFSVDENKITNLVLFPNPAHHELIISSTEVIDEIRLFDIKGNLLLITSNSSNRYFVDISELDKGMYLISASFKNQPAKVKRFVKN